jgi:hypothetical protein
VTSNTTYRTGALQAWERYSLKLPARGNPEARALAQKWSATEDDPEIIVQKALALFRANAFYYTLNAPMLDVDIVDDFLFQSRRGYCEHYASAFVFLMRAADIPARIIGGYLGGEVNPYGNYILVKQSDAHAWAEVWLAQKGWVRVDPTSAVAPERVEQGVSAALPPDERLTIRGFSDLDFGPLTPYVKQIGLGWDMINSRWNGWVLGYSYLRQQALFSKFGLPQGSLRGPVAATFGTAALVCLASLGFFIWMHRRIPRKSDPVLAAYMLFCDRLSRAGLPRPPGQGPLDYARRVVSVRPDMAETVQRITGLYVFIRYAEKGDEKTVKAFTAAVNRFHPNPAEPD